MIMAIHAAQENSIRERTKCGEDARRVDIGTGHRINCKTCLKIIKVEEKGKYYYSPINYHETEAFQIDHRYAIMYQSLGMTLRQIADKYGVTSQSVSHRLKRYNKRMAEYNKRVGEE
jgi:DNA-directed RNA polymerase specialized sigma subunit